MQSSSLQQTKRPPLSPALREAFLAGNSLEARTSLFREAFAQFRESREAREDGQIALFVLGDPPCVSPEGIEEWNFFGIYAQSLNAPSDSQRNNRPRFYQNDQIAIDRCINRFEELLADVSKGQIKLHWPLQYRSIKPFSARVSPWRDWIDALPTQAHARHFPLLLDASYVAGEAELGKRFLNDIEALIFPQFITEIDTAYLAAFLDENLRKLKSSEASQSGLGVQRVQANAFQSSIRNVRAVMQIVHRIRGDKSSWETLEQRLATHASIATCAKRWNSKLEDIANPWVEIPAEELRDWITMCEAWGNEFLPVEASLKSSHATSILCSSPLLEGNDSQRLQSLNHGLQELALEDSRVLSSRNCRYQLARISQRLLSSILATPAPQNTLNQLVSTSRSLGGKGVLWELFSSHAPSLDLYIRLCGSSPTLVQILLNNPGMIDDLLDSLMLESLPSLEQLRGTLDELHKSPDEPHGITLAFRNAMHLAIGVRDILGKENISETHRALADVQEACLIQLLNDAYGHVASSVQAPLDADGQPLQCGLIALGKIGGREPNYHSDVPVVLVYNSRANQLSESKNGNQATEVFFHRVAQRLFQTANRATGHGRLFELKPWTFASHREALLAWELQDFLSFLTSNEASKQIRSIEHRALLFTARVIADHDFVTRTEPKLEATMHQRLWTREDSVQLIAWRRALEESATPQNIKRGWGGTLDVETLAHLFYAKHIHRPQYPVLRGTVERLDALRKNGILSPFDALQLRDAYHFLRGVESGLRLMNTKHRHDIPTSELELAQLAMIIQLPDTDQLLESIEHYRRIIRDISQRYYAQIRAESIGMRG